MAKIFKYKESLDFFLKLIDSRINDQDYLGALDASRRAYNVARTRVSRESLNLITAEIYFNMELYHLSLEYYFRAIQVNEVCASAMFGIGVCLMKMQQHSLAIEYFDECSRTPSNINFAPLIENILNSTSATHNFATTNLAKKLMDNNQLTEAITLLLNQKNANLKTQILLAEAYLKTQQYDLARETLFALLKLNPNYTPALLTLCKLCEITNDLPNLATILSNLNTILPNFEHYMQIAHYYCVLKNWDCATKAYEQATLISPYDVTAETLLALCYLNQNNKTEALFHIGKARWIDIENPLVNELSDLIQKDLITPPIDVVMNLPYNLAQQKQHDVISSLNNQFCKTILSSMWLHDDIEWALSTHNLLLSSKIIEKLSKCKHKRNKLRYKNYLLSLKLTKNQKFYLIKNAILSKNLKIIPFTTEYRIKTLRYFIPKNLDKIMLNSYANALSYCAIFDIEFYHSNLEQIFLKIKQNGLSENEGTCLFFAHNSVIFQNACIYFKVNQSKLEKIISSSENLDEK